MVNFDEIEFLDCEIVDDDPDAPVGTLVRVSDDGTVETVAVQQPVSNDVSDVESVANDVEPIVETTADVQPMVEDVVEQDVTASQEPAVETENTVATPEPIQELTVEEPVTKDVSPAPKKKAAPKKTKQPATDAPVVEHKALNLKSGESVNDALASTSFEIQQPAKAKIVSTKKKQEKQEDLWAVATISKPKKATPVVEEKQDEPVEPAPKKTRKKAEANVDNSVEQQEPTAKKKSAPKAATNVENTTQNTEENEVAKATDKTTAPQDEKAVKAAKATKPVENNDETILVEGEGKIHGKFVIKKTDKGNFVFKLYSSNHRVVAIGAQAYTTLGAAKIGVQSVINNAEKAPVENQTLKNVEVQKFPKWEIYTDKKGEFRLRLFATNGSLIATTNDGYVDISGAKNGIAAVARACKGCAIARNDNLW